MSSNSLWFSGNGEENYYCYIWKQRQVIKNLIKKSVQDTEIFVQLNLLDKFEV